MRVWWRLMRPIGEANGYVHHLIDHSKGELSDAKGNHINDLEGFWGYRKRHRAGIRRERLPLYVAQYVWRFNHRNCITGEHITILLKMLYNYKHIRKTERLRIVLYTDFFLTSTSFLTNVL
ncbi:MAG: hypothetical protein A2Y65_06635 [Deltaproteobacteria bacterium RBG_13_52_11]|nr:MAG: hypothetical protein A2Y65_06635 [Deltaproteobacteria bacterium RBG_13_52_11]